MGETAQGRDGHLRIHQWLLQSAPRLGIFLCKTLPAMAVTQHWVGKALSPLSERWLKRALGAALKRDRSRTPQPTADTQHQNPRNISMLNTHQTVPVSRSDLVQEPRLPDAALSPERKILRKSILFKAVGTALCCRCLSVPVTASAVHLAA